MATATKSTAPAPVLPYPVGIRMNVYRDDGRWGDYSAWWIRPHTELRSLHVARITLAHWEGTDEPAYTSAEWADKARRLIEEYPNCVFVYT